ncbi:hypothetical protein PF005_g3736 [Phytophthora fragariae]|uniref:GH10 domain-containing protein n=3 Tax=Phytophthora TaxID=4783 RepID=A0A6A3FRT6_9STRA|nr:hypothetical protein PF009_g3230 [Phytophthora fragariae]KAE9051702.1 hypothetical protein PR001_g1188 [Phytophthora rubi]KAE9025864.1 hypothetical protein PF011_g2848 [Phytophthora fragariae]KAE9152871.1 hypothetical protein PF006_g2961 [Phytophthora fragariae]KAE9229803.1 hypothetical protein PF005_g3736 [Phytophthora fragariae]
MKMAWGLDMEKYLLELVLAARGGPSGKGLKKKAWHSLDDAMKARYDRDMQGIERRTWNFPTTAFKTAYKVKKYLGLKTKLYYDDYNTITINAKSTAVCNMVKKLLNYGVTAVGVGFKSHFTSFSPSTQEQIQQASVLMKTVAACKQVDKCFRVTIWGYDDNYL